MDIAELETRLADWYKKRHGDAPFKFGSTLCELMDKLARFARAIDQLSVAVTPQGVVALAVEGADAVFVIAHILRATGGSLDKAVEAKLKLIEDRLATNPPTPKLYLPGEN